jgi:uncharacterized Zn finger protein (UPF0148 family)
MGREVPFNKNAKCDTCGKTGAFDFMGDLICSDCAERAQAEAEKAREREAHMDCYQYGKI